MSKLQFCFQQFDREKTISCVDIVTYPVVSSYLFFASPKGEVVSHSIPSATYRDEKTQLYNKHSCENDMKLFHSLYLILTLSQLGIIHITRVRTTKSDFSLYWNTILLYQRNSCSFQLLLIVIFWNPLKSIYYKPLECSSQRSTKWRHFFRLMWLNNLSFRQG